MSGDAGKTGAKSELSYLMGKRVFVLIETITLRNFPDEFHAKYDTNGMWNQMHNFFTDKGEITTWKTVSEFKGTNFSMKAMLFLMPRKFKERTMHTMNDFKKYAENA